MAAKKLKPSDLNALWHKAPVEQWLRVIRRANPEGKWQQNGKTIIGCCPYHDDKTPSFILNFQKGFGKCHGQCGKVVRDLINFYARISGQSYVAALTDLSTEIDIPQIIGPGANDLAGFSHLQEMKKQTVSAMRLVTEEYIRDKSKHLEYLNPGLLYLTNGRNIPLNVLSTLPVTLYAKPEHIKKYLPGEFHESFEKYFKDTRGAAVYGAPCFHYNDAPGSISRFKIRKLVFEANKLCGKVGFERQLVSKEFVVLPDEYAQDMGIFGLHFYNRMLGGADTDAYLTEGEFDSLAIMAAQGGLGRMDFMCLATGGSGQTTVAFLREFGLRVIRTMQDCPAKNGDGIVKGLLKNSRNFVGDAENQALVYKIFTWPPEMRGLDLDDAVQNIGYDNVADIIYTDRSRNFLNSDIWVEKKCEAEIKAVRAEAERNKLENSETAQANINDDCNKMCVDVVKSWLSCVHTPSGKLSFMEKATSLLGMDIRQIETINASVYDLQSMDGAQHRVAEALHKYVEIAYYNEQPSGGLQYTIWSKRRKHTMLLPLTDRGIELVLSQCVGRSVSDWVKELLAGSSLLHTKTNGQSFDDYNRVKSVTTKVLTGALDTLYPAAPPKNGMARVGQGIHYTDIKQTPGEEAIYFVNGNKVYRGVYNANSSTPIEWEYLDRNVDKDLFFLLDMQKTWSDVDDVSDLYASGKVDAKKLYGELCKILDGWRFEQHALTRDYLAAWILSLPIQRALSQVNMTFITGASASGKTSLLRGLLGGNLNKTSFEIPTILEGSWFSSDASAAGIYQEMDESALSLCLDEAEARQGSAHSERVSAFQELAYSIPFGGASPARGGSSREGRVQYAMQMPVIMAAINMAAQPVFLSRIVPIYTEKNVNQKNIGTYLYENFSDADIERIRRQVTVCFLDKLPELYLRARSLRRTLSAVQTNVPISDRCITTYLPGLLIYDFLGFDAKKMFVDLVYKNRELLENINSQDFHSELLNAVLYSPGIQLVLDDKLRNVVPAKELILYSEYDKLNNSGCGVYFINNKGWIIIVWRDVKYSLLRNTKYRDMDEATLKESVSKNKYLVNHISSADHSMILKFMGRQDIKNQSQYTVVTAGYLFDDSVRASNNDYDEDFPPPSEEMNFAL